MICTKIMEDLTTYEYCPHCETEVELKAELSVQKCPNCGMFIVACSMCDKCISPCKLEDEAKNLNTQSASNQATDKKTYTVNITMHLLRMVEIEAASEADAIRLARAMVHSETIVFDANSDCSGIDVSIDK